MHGIPKTLAILASLFVGISQAADPPASPIRLPFVKQEPTKPLPADQVVPLTADVTYVIESDVPVLVFSSPGGSVVFEKIPGPARLRGVFIGGTGVKEWKTFTSKYLVVVDALKDGRDELVVLPAGAKDEAEAKRVTFQIGQMPNPPPKPPGPTPVVKAVWLLVVEETNERTVPTATVLTDLMKNKANLEAAGITYRVYDKDSEYGKNYRATAVEKGVSSLPAVLIIDKAAKDGTEPLGVFALPKTFAELEAKVKPYTGGK